MTGFRRPMLASVFFLFLFLFKKIHLQTPSFKNRLNANNRMPLFCRLTLCSEKHPRRVLPGQGCFIRKKKGGSLSVTVNSLFRHSNLMLSATRLERLAESSYSRESSITTNTGFSSVYAQAAGLSKAWKPSPTVHMAGAHS